MNDTGLIVGVDPSKVVVVSEPDDDTKVAIADLHARVDSLEKQLKALQSATAHITSIRPIQQ